MQIVVLDLSVCFLFPPNVTDHLNNNDHGRASMASDDRATVFGSTGSLCLNRVKV